MPDNGYGEGGRHLEAEGGSVLAGKKTLPKTGWVKWTAGGKRLHESLISNTLNTYIENN